MENVSVFGKKRLTWPAYAAPPTRLATALPAQKAAQSRNQPYHGVKLRNCFGYYFPVTAPASAPQ